MTSEKNVRQNIPNKVPCMILCAGTSKRFGSNKMLAPLAGKPLLAHTIERLRPQVCDLALNGDGAEYDEFGLPVFPDAIGGKFGPLAGILTAMEWAAELGCERVVTVSGDTPFVPGYLVEALMQIPNGNVVLSQTGEQRHQICGLWPVCEATNLRAFLENGRSYKVRDFLTLCETIAVKFEKKKGVDPFFNVNTREDMEIAERILSARD